MATRLAITEPSAVAPDAGSNFSTKYAGNLRIKVDTGIRRYPDASGFCISFRGV